MTMKSTDQLLSLRAAAARLGIHVTTMRAWVRSGRVPAYRVGQRFVRVNWDDVLAAIASGRCAERIESATDDRHDAVAGACAAAAEDERPGTRPLGTAR